MVTIAGIPIPIPTTVGGAVGFLINALLAFAVIIIIDEVINHEFQAKHSFIMAIGAYFITPIVFALIGITGISAFFGFLTTYLIPLIVWVALGEILLEGDGKTKAIVAAVAFIVYTVLIFIGIPTIITSALPF